jgi:DHA1 family multidrug resistance protein-like MFS transporter
MFDGAMSYFVPIVFSEAGHSNTVIGLIIGTSSLVGACFDFIICKFFKNVSFRRIFLLMFILSAFFPLILWQFKTVPMFILAMALWGIYYDFYGFGVFDFVGRYVKSKMHATTFGIVEIAISIGYFLGPLIAGLVVFDVVDFKGFGLAWLFLLISILFFVALLILSRKLKQVNKEVRVRKRSFIVEVGLWKNIGKLLAPVLVLTLYLYIIASSFWTLIPLFGEELDNLGLGGLLLGATTLPAILMGFFVGDVSKRFGKKRTAIYGLLVGSLLLSLFCLFTNVYALLALLFIASCFFGLAFPSMNGAYADYISESPKYEQEIEALEDFSFNLAYIFGPMIAGFVSDLTNISITFTLFGLVGIFVAIILIKVTPRHIQVA